MPDRVYIKDLRDNEPIEGVFNIQNCQLGQTRNGKPFLKCLLADKTGRLAARMWSATEELFEYLPTDGFVRVRGQTQPYQGEIQIIIQQIEPWEPTDDDLIDLLPSTEFDIDDMFAQLKAIIATLEHADVNALADAYLNDDELMAKFRRAPAAMTLHHAFLGGLLEHTLQLMKVADAALPLYPQLNRDIVLMGLFLHDLGKCVELSWEVGFSYTDEGHLVGHIARGSIWLQRKADDCRALGHKISEPILRVLHHIILSHHGQPEFGALKIPATPEAMFVSLIDNVDAKMHMVLAAAKRSDTRAADIASDSTQANRFFSEKIWALDTRVYRPDPTTLPDEA